jgi:hypothetical protein
MVDFFLSIGEAVRRRRLEFTTFRADVRASDVMDRRNQPNCAQNECLYQLWRPTHRLEIPDAIAYYVDNADGLAKEWVATHAKPSRFDIQQDVYPTGIKILPAPKRRRLRATNGKTGNPRGESTKISWACRLATSNS